MGSRLPVRLCLPCVAERRGIRWRRSLRWHIAPGTEQVIRAVGAAAAAAAVPAEALCILIEVLLEGCSVPLKGFRSQQGPGTEGGPLEAVCTDHQEISLNHW